MANSTYILIHLPSFFSFFFLGILSIKRTLLPPTPFFLTTSIGGTFLPFTCIFIATCYHEFSLLFHHHSSFFFFVCSFIHSSCLNIRLLSFYSSLFYAFRLIPSPFLFITLRVRRSLLPWAHPWKVSLMGRI